MQGDTTPSTDAGSSEIFPYRGSLEDAERSRGPQRKSHSRAFASRIVRFRPRRIIARIVVAIAPVACPLAAMMAIATSVRAQTATRSETIDRFAGFIAEASTRFAVPVSWIRAVMQIESAGDGRATSPRGALGLMQLMPATWIDLSARYGPGLDPFDPRDNILAGAAYLKEMYKRFGLAGFLAAYHAGPSRYEQHLATGQPLPPDTVTYVAAVTPLLGKQQVDHGASGANRAIPWQQSPLFFVRVNPRD